MWNKSLRLCSHATLIDSRRPLPLNINCFYFLEIAKDCNLHSRYRRRRRRRWRRTAIISLLMTSMSFCQWPLATFRDNRNPNQTTSSFLLQILFPRRYRRRYHRRCHRRHRRRESNAFYYLVSRGMPFANFLSQSPFRCAHSLGRIYMECGPSQLCNRAWTVKCAPHPSAAGNCR